MIVMELNTSLVVAFEHEIAVPDEGMVLKQEPKMKDLNREPGLYRILIFHKMLRPFDLAFPGQVLPKFLIALLIIILLGQILFVE